MYQLSVIILSFNTKDLLQKCLTALYQQKADFSFEVIVVDNASEDDSVEMLKNKFPNARVLVNKENVGFARGVNQAAGIATGEYLFFLNSDAVLENNSLKKGLMEIAKNENIGIVGGMLKNPNGTIQRSYGRFYDLPQAFLMLLAGDKLEIARQKQTVKEVEWVSGGLMLVRKDLFSKEKFDENFFMYLEDMELCFRIKKKGYQVIFAPGFSAIHQNHASSSRGFAIINIYKGLLYFYKKHKPFWQFEILKAMLRAKAYLVIFLAYLTDNYSLAATYRQALKF